MSDQWLPGFVLPNIDLQEPVDGGDLALVPVTAERVQQSCREHATLSAFLGRFTDAFGVPLRPTVLLIRAEAPERLFEIDVVASFRNLVALSVIPYCRAQAMKYGRQGGIHYSNSFSFYPWMLREDFKYLVGKTDAMLGIHSMEKFRGQSSPEIPGGRVSSLDVDAPLLESLLSSWRRWSVADEPEVADTALFRSLNMAYHAAMLPAGTDPTFFDHGRLGALWVSAFEILVHPGEGGRADVFEVFDLIERVAWTEEGCRGREYETRKKGARTKEWRTLASHLYEKLYNARSNFLHGNPVTTASVMVGNSGRSIFSYAAPLYRLALTAFLSITHSEPMLDETDANDVGPWLAARMTIEEKQRTYEEALLTSVRSPQDADS